MKGIFVNIDTAKLAKEKKFHYELNSCFVEYIRTVESDNPSFAMTKGYVEIESGYFVNDHFDLSNKNYICYGRPTQSLLQTWLRNEHDVQVYAYSHTKKNGKWGDYVVYVDNTAINDARDEEFQTYEDALEIGLQHALTKL